MLKIFYRNYSEFIKQIITYWKKVKKYLPFFIGFKLLTFTGFITYIMNR